MSICALCSILYNRLFATVKKVNNKFRNIEKEKYIEFQPNLLLDLKNSVDLNSTLENLKSSEENNENTTSIFDDEISNEEESADSSDKITEKSYSTSVLRDEEGKISQIFYYDSTNEIGDIVKTKTAEYNESGQLVQISIDDNNDGIIDEIASIEYDENGNIAKYADAHFNYESDYNMMTTFSYVTENTYTWDESGEIEEVLKSYSYNSPSGEVNTIESKIIRSDDGSILIDDENDGIYDYSSDNDVYITSSLNRIQEDIQEFSADIETDTDTNE